jgi:SAM-dependent methyltransferase
MSDNFILSLLRAALPALPSRPMNQADYWNGEAGAIWVSVASDLDPVLAPLGEAAMDALAPARGERVLDVGCGAGATSRALKQRVGEEGEVLGVDVSGPLVEAARARGGGPAYLLADAGSAAFPGGPFDAVFSRFGVMFFEDPVAAFAHLRGATRAGGRLAFVCWGPLAENPWATEPVIAALPLLREPPPPPVPNAPGPFAFADEGRLRGILASAGWSEIDLRRLGTDYGLGASVERAVDICLRVGPLARLAREQALDPAPIRDVLRGLLERHRTAGGGVAMPASCWIVTARRAAA